MVPFEERLDLDRMVRKLGSNGGPGVTIRETDSSGPRASSGSWEIPETDMRRPVIREEPVGGERRSTISDVKAGPELQFGEVKAFREKIDALEEALLERVCGIFANDETPTDIKQVLLDKAAADRKTQLQEVYRSAREQMQDEIGVLGATASKLGPAQVRRLADLKKVLKALEYYAVRILEMAP